MEYKPLNLYGNENVILAKSEIIEDAPYEVNRGISPEYAMLAPGNSNCGSKCSSRSSRSRARMRNIADVVKEE